MIDKIIRTGQNELMIIYTNRPPFTIYSSDGNPIALWAYLNSPTNLSHAQTIRAIDTATEETCPSYNLPEENT